MQDDEGSKVAATATKATKVKLKAPGKGAKPGKKAGKKGAVHMDGVGTGALEAAKLYATFDLDTVATWAAGQPVPYAFLAAAFDEINAVTKRLVIIGILVKVFRAIIARTPGDLLPAVYLCINKVPLLT